MGKDLTFTVPCYGGPCNCQPFTVAKVGNVKLLIAARQLQTLAKAELDGKEMTAEMRHFKAVALRTVQRYIRDSGC